MNKVTMTLAPLNGAVAESGKPLQTITLTLMGYVVHGQKGDPGVGVPAGGLTGQVLAKSSNADYATQWVDQIGGGGGGGGTWGSITGTLSSQTDLQNALDGKSDKGHDHDGIYVKPGSLAAVATSGSYADLSGKPALGSAAAASTGDFASAAQGAKADSALQAADITGKLDKAGGVMTGPINFAGTQTWPTFNQSTTGSAATLTTARTLTIGGKGYTFDGSANVTWTLADIGAASTSHSHSDATTGAAGFLSAADKTKLDGIAAGAQVNTVTSVAGRTGDVEIAADDVSGLGSLATKSSVAVADVSATGTPGSETFLRGDSVWATPAGGSGLPSQTGQAGNYLTTDGTSASWAPVVGGSVAPGTIQYFVSDPGAGWLECDASAYARSSYANLTMLPDAPSNVFSALTTGLSSNSVAAATNGLGTWVVVAAGEGNNYAISYDDGDTWAVKSHSSRIGGVATDGAGKWVIGTGMYGKLLVSTDDAMTWADSAVVIDDAWEVKLGTGGYGLWFAGQSGTQWWVSTDNAASWSKLSTPPGSAAPSLTAVLDGVLFAAGANLFKASTNQGASWSEGRLTDTGIGGAGLAKAIAKGADGVVCVAAAQGLLRSAFGGFDFAYPPQPTLGTPALNAVATNGRGVWLTGGAAGLLWRSVDNGLTWAPIVSGFGSDAINAIAYADGAWMLFGDAGQARRCVDDATRFITPYIPGAWVKT